ncbi:MAG: DNA polymerase III subunit epsilon [Rhodospirillaceae bacterium]|jgi:DNA polymerase III subunit epsilon|nr:DNA polymerase III subunit epsilon [Rhodospirillaceae bacterium]MBT5941486.1 DNA polymerase III subunit epsilon [Rhodospirillaceae bacterium]MBT7957206.1 DNA polymerase III subunit epsilon [Rhodospirillaceae bacterium]
MREIVLDTETTGFRQNDGDRIVEIGCIELVNHVATGNNYHQYINPERDMPDEAFGVHGLSEEFLSDFPVMADVMEAFLEFIGDDTPLVIHNAEFDMRFINAELGHLGLETLPMSRSIDTVRMAREKFPGAPASLDALCRRFEIDNTSRTLHGALLDAELLAEVYLELIGGRQQGFELAQDKAGETIAAIESQRRDPRPHAASEAEQAAHAAFLEKIKDPLWTS